MDPEGYSKYAALANTIKIEDVTSDEHNQIILQRLKDNDTSLDKLWIYNNECNDIGDNSSDYYVPDHVEELGWLGYYIGQNTNLQELYFYENHAIHTNMYNSDAEPFFRGLKYNRSIKCLDFNGFNLSEGRLFSMMTSFLKSNSMLHKITVEDCEFGVEGARQLSLAIGDCSKSLNELSIDSNEMVNGQVVDIITTLSVHPQLERLSFAIMNIGSNECAALSTLLRYTATKLKSLNLYRANIDDEGMEVLVGGLGHHKCQELNLGSNRSITIRGWTALSTLLETTDSKLETLNVEYNTIGDEEALVFAKALSSNSTLKLLGLKNNGISAEGWEPFSKLLCDTSSINDTYLSNHTLLSFNRYNLPPSGASAGLLGTLSTNGSENKQKVAMAKILLNHSHFDMEPFFEWEFKILPLMVKWFEKVSTFTSGFEEKINKLRLSAIYDFIKEFPMLYIESVTRKEIIEFTVEVELHQGVQMDAEQEFRLEEIRRCKARSMRRLGME